MCEQGERNTSQAKVNSNKPILVPLIPKSNIDLGYYKNTLDFVFSNDEVRNIAVSGAYGSGKSSVIATYEKDTKNKFLHISLAHFAPNHKEKVTSEKEKTENRNDDDTEHQRTPNISVLEWKILNQLVHQIDPPKIPQTLFRVKKNTSKKGLIFVSALALVFIATFMHTLLFNRWINFYNTLNVGCLKLLLSFTEFAEFRLFTLIMCVVLAGLGLFRLLVLQRDRRIIKKLDVKGAEIEMFADNNESYFDKYLNEVLYLFENVEQNVIVFEDIDRFDSNVIFERLREINTLINYSRRVGKPPIRFFYLLRDDIFTNKDRTKFFDLIIPIVPVIDGSNSYNKFIEVLSNSGILEHFNSMFLQGFSLYIDEMRLLLNICNEYIVYYQQIGKSGTEIDTNKLLAMIAFKNLFPCDFAELQLGRGYVFTLLNLKDDLIKEEQKRLSSEISALKDKIENTKNEHLRSEEEVDQIYKSKLDNLKQSLRSYHYDQQLKISTQKEIDEINEKISLRKENIRNRTENGNTELLIKISNFEKQITELRSRRIKDLLSRKNIEETFASIEYTNPLGITDKFKKVKDNPYFLLLIFLIRNGHIDETYKDYMTYFYPNSLTTRDAAFCRSVTDQKTKPPEYSLDNPAMIVNRLPIEYFRQIEVLNYSLLDFLLAKSTQPEQLTLLVEQLADNKLYDFIRRYFTNGREIEKFVTVVNTKWPTLFSELLARKELDHNSFYLFVLYTIYNSIDEDINAVNVDGCLTKFISENDKFLNIENPRVECIIDRLKKLNVLFVTIDADTAHQELLFGVYENCLYKLTLKNITTMLQKFYKLESSDEFAHRNYSLILSRHDSPLAMYVNKDIVGYITEIIKNCDDKITDDKIVALSVLNNENIPIELKQRYISLLKTELSLLIDVTDTSLWKDLLKSSDSIIYSEKNVIDYFISIGDQFDDILTDWINQQTVRLDFSENLLSDFIDEKRDKFLDAVVQCNSLRDDKYSEFTKTIERKYEEFIFEDIEEKKMKILIENSVIMMNPENLEFVRNNYSKEVLYHFITKRIDEYDQIIEEQPNLLDVTEMEYVISTESGVLQENQLKLLKLKNGKLSIKGKSYSDLIKLYILSHNFSEDDYEYLINDYDKFSNDIRKTIVNLIASRIEKTIEMKYPISKTLFDDLIDSSQMSDEQIKYILALALPNIGENDCIEYLITHGLEQFADIFDKNKKPQFENTKLNKFILDCFFRWNKISEYNIGENGKIHIRH